MTTTRNDIQALRGLAVLSVVLFHFRFGGFEAGYLGVDMFFVISGFLITTLVARQIEDGRFRLSEFYFRRAKRLLPAAYLTIGATALIAPYFLNQRELRDFAWQVVGALTFTANGVLWQQADYFQGPADLKPLLHMWSLALEEQYYLLLPPLLLVLPRRWWLRVVGCALALSLALCLAGMFLKPVATFYLLPTRAWELLVGSIGALWIARSKGQPSEVADLAIVKLLFGPALLSLLVLPLVPLGQRHPGVAAIAICAATLIVILRGHPVVERSPVTRGLAFVGDFSYSLYLVHWPIAALLKNAWSGPGTELPLHLRLLGLALSVLLAYPLYRWVEDPIRRASFRYSGGLFAKTALASLALMAITPLIVSKGNGPLDFAELRKINYGLNAACEYTENFKPKPECRSSEAPGILVWGDSNAMHLVPGLLNGAGAKGVMQATRSNCGPVIGLAPYRMTHPGVGPVYDRAWAESCIEFNQSVLEFVLANPSIKTVVLSSVLIQYTQDGWKHMARSGRGFDEGQPDAERTAEAFRRTVQRLRDAGKNVVLFAPPPSVDVDLSACQERRMTGRIVLTSDGRDDCEISVAQYRQTRAPVIDLLARLERKGVPVLRFDSFLCDAEACRTLVDDTLIYRDEGHLSHEGSRLLAERMNWMDVIDRGAEQRQPLR